jgi:hypothetical protein
MPVDQIDPFTTSAGLSDSLDNTNKHLQTLIKNTALHALNQSPRSDPSDMRVGSTPYQDQPSGLPQLLKDGSFAVPILDGALPLAKSITASIAAPVVNYLWNILLSEYPARPSAAAPVKMAASSSTA